MQRDLQRPLDRAAVTGRSTHLRRALRRRGRERQGGDAGAPAYGKCASDCRSPALRRWHHQRTRGVRRRPGEGPAVQAQLHDRHERRPALKGRRSAPARGNSEAPAAPIALGRPRTGRWGRSPRAGPAAGARRDSARKCPWPLSAAVARWVPSAQRAALSVVLFPVMTQGAEAPRVDSSSSFEPWWRKARATCITVGAAALRIDGEVIPLKLPPLTKEDTKQLAYRSRPRSRKSSSRRTASSTSRSA